VALQSVNPANGDVLATYEEVMPVQVHEIVAKTHAAFLSWRSTSFDDRARPMREAGKILCSKREEYARLKTVYVA
jgi:succinate-semialdehyde dehydrogenase/glutarate-semialdehyde dehydrogenase